MYRVGVLSYSDGSVYGCCWDIRHVSFTLLGWVKDRVSVALSYLLARSVLVMPAWTS